MNKSFEGLLNLSILGFRPTFEVNDKGYGFPNGDLKLVTTLMVLRILFGLKN